MTTTVEHAQPTKRRSLHLSATNRNKGPRISGSGFERPWRSYRGGVWHRRARARTLAVIQTGPAFRVPVVLVRCRRAVGPHLEARAGLLRTVRAQATPRQTGHLGGLSLGSQRPQGALPRTPLHARWRCKKRRLAPPHHATMLRL